MGNEHSRPRSARFRAGTFLLAGAVVGAMLAGPTVAGAAGGNRQVWKFVKSKLSAPGTLNKANNPVDFTRLKNVPAGFADGVDDVGGIGDITTRTAGIVIQGGGAENGAYVLDFVERYCDPGERALSGSGYFSGDLNPGGPGGADDLEVFIASVEFRVNGSGHEGYRVWGGNDSGVNRTLVAQVRCMAP